MSEERMRMMVKPSYGKHGQIQPRLGFRRTREKLATSASLQGLITEERGAPANDGP